MSYFCATNIKIDKKLGTWRVKGDDNNVHPRYNEWTREIPLFDLLFNVSSGIVQFTHRTRKNIYIEQTAFKYKNIMLDRFGISPYDIQLTTCGWNDIEQWIFNLKRGVSQNYWNKETALKLIPVLENQNLLAEIKKLNEAFIAEALTLPKPRKSFIMRNDGMYVRRIYSRGFRITPRREGAKPLDLIEAEDAIRRLGFKDYLAIVA